VGGRKYFAHHVEHGIVIESITNLLEFLQEPFEYPALDGIGGHEVEDQTVLRLAVAVNAPHALLEAVRIPRDVVVEHNVAALEVDALAGCLGRHEHLDLPILELLLRIEPGAGIIA